MERAFYIVHVAHGSFSLNIQYKFSFIISFIIYIINERELARQDAIMLGGKHHLDEI